MNKAYIVMRKGYEYDDNIYNQTEGGNPQIICFSKEDAKAKVKELNIKEYMESDIRDYAYDLDDCIRVEWLEFENFNKSLAEKYGKIESRYTWDNSENKLHPKANEDEINEYCKMVSISFYEVAEVDIDMASWRDKQVNNILD